MAAHLETLVLENFLDSNILALFRDVEKLGGEDDAKGAVPDDFAIGIRYVPLIA